MPPPLWGGCLGPRPEAPPHALSLPARSPPRPSLAHLGSWRLLGCFRGRAGSAQPPPAGAAAAPSAAASTPSAISPLPTHVTAPQPRPSVTFLLTNSTNFGAQKKSCRDRRYRRRRRCCPLPSSSSSAATAIPPPLATTDSQCREQQPNASICMMEGFTSAASRVRAAHGAAVRRHLAEVIANSGPLQEALPTLAEANLQPPLAHVCAMLENGSKPSVHSGNRSRIVAEYVEDGLLSGLNEDYEKHRHQNGPMVTVDQMARSHYLVFSTKMDLVYKILGKKRAESYSRDTRSLDPC